ncbi:MAG: hypothetical protein ACFFBD_22440, partial [Candidatus Hodarchaeota archaeon]
MSLEILQEDGFARYGKLWFAEQSFRTPCLCQAIFAQQNFPYIGEEEKSRRDIPKVYFLPSLQYLGKITQLIPLEKTDGIVILPKDYLLNYREHIELED